MSPCVASRHLGCPVVADPHGHFLQWAASTTAPDAPRETMRLSLEIDLDKLSGDPVREVGRMLRYWGSNMNGKLLEPGVARDLYDSTYAEAVGKLTVDDPRSGE